MWTKRRHVLSLLTITGVALALAACSVGAEPSPTPSATPTSAATPTDPTEELWGQVTARFPDASRPDAALVRFVSVTEMPQVQADCMHEQGFPDVRTTPDGGVTIANVPEGQQEALAVARYVCGVQYQVDPKYTDPFTTDEVNQLYDYFTTKLAPCLEAEGYAVPDIPSRGTFLDSYASTGWNPYVSVETPSQDEWYRINLACPPWPEGFWG